MLGAPQPVRAASASPAAATEADLTLLMTPVARPTLPPESVIIHHRHDGFATLSDMNLTKSYSRSGMLEPSGGRG